MLGPETQPLILLSLNDVKNIKIVIGWILLLQNQYKPILHNLPKMVVMVSINKSFSAGFILVSILVWILKNKSHKNI